MNSLFSLLSLKIELWPPMKRCCKLHAMHAVQCGICSGGRRMEQKEITRQMNCSANLIAVIKQWQNGGDAFVWCWKSVQPFVHRCIGARCPKQSVPLNISSWFSAAMFCHFGLLCLSLWLTISLLLFLTSWSRTVYSRMFILSFASVLLRCEYVCVCAHLCWCFVLVHHRCTY